MRMPSSRRFLFAIGVLLLAAGAALVGYRRAPQAFKTQVRILSARIAGLNIGYIAPRPPTSRKVSEADGMVEIYVPAGEFRMGTNQAGFLGSRPEHKVYLDSFWIDQSAISNAMYAKCVQAGRCQYRYDRPGYNSGYSDPLHRDDPVTYVSWQEAHDYCNWAGRRLPTEAEWEKAARGTQAQLYPWGNKPPDLSLLNFNNNIGSPVSVFYYPRGASPFGVLQMEGNVREWMQDWFSRVYYFASPYRNPQGPESGKTKVLRGASYNDNEHGVLVFVRFDHVPTSRGANRGFRCAETASQ